MGQNSHHPKFCPDNNTEYATYTLRRYEKLYYSHNELSGENRIAPQQVQNGLKEQWKETGLGFSRWLRMVDWGGGSAESAKLLSRGRIGLSYPFAQIRGRKGEERGIAYRLLQSNIQNRITICLWHFLPIEYLGSIYWT